MNKVGPTVGRVALSCAALLVATPVWAGPGDHVRLGAFTLTPSLSAGVEYHSNVYLTHVDPTGAPSFLVVPRLSFEADKPDWSVLGGVGYQLRKYADLAPDDDANVQNLDRFNDVNANLAIDGLRRSVVGFRLSDRFQVVNTPAELQTSDANANIVTTSNDLNGGVLIRPGSAIEIGLLGQFGFDNYRVPEGYAETADALNYNDRSSYGPTLDAKWKFLPKTSLRGGGSVVWNRWRNNLIRAAGPEAEGLDYGEYLGKPDSLAWRTQWGVKGQFTPKLGAELSLGYGQAYYDEQSVLDSAQAASLPDSSQELDLTGSTDNGETFARDLKSFGEGLLAVAQVGWAPIAGHALNLGYKKDFQDAFFTNYVAYQTVFVRYEGALTEEIGLDGQIGLRFDGFHGEVARRDRNLELRLQGAWHVTSFLSAQAGGAWRQRACGEAGCAGGVFAPTEYDDFAATLGVTVQY